MAVGMEANFVLFLLPSMPHHIFCGKRRQGKTKKEGTQEDENYRASGDTSYTALKEKRLRDQSGFIALLRRKREKWTEGKKSPPQKRKRRNPRRNLSLSWDTQGEKNVMCDIAKHLSLIRWQPSPPKPKPRRRRPPGPSCSGYRVSSCGAPGWPAGRSCCHTGSTEKKKKQNNFRLTNQQVLCLFC